MNNAFLSFHSDKGVCVPVSTGNISPCSPQTIQLSEKLILSQWKVRILNDEMFSCWKDLTGGVKKKIFTGIFFSKPWTMARGVRMERIRWPRTTWRHSVQVNKQNARSGHPLIEKNNKGNTQTYEGGFNKARGTRFKGFVYASAFKWPI